MDSPLIVSPDDLAEVQALARQKDGLTALLDDPPTARDVGGKNTSNNMTAAYAKEQRRKYLKETAQNWYFPGCTREHRIAAHVRICGR